MTMNNDEFKRKWVPDENLTKANEAVDRLEQFIREGFRDTDEKIKKLQSGMNALNESDRKTDSSGT
ncbi:MAG TPA: hypothetical protein VJT15_21820 [Pyrinomonadaceae bacterium]|nr:hypothetical protein [Pyrinomonadaceae bacterium]